MSLRQTQWTMALPSSTIVQDTLISHLSGVFGKHGPSRYFVLQWPHADYMEHLVVIKPYVFTKGKDYEEVLWNYEIFVWLIFSPLAVSIASLLKFCYPSLGKDFFFYFLLRSYQLFLFLESLNWPRKEMTLSLFPSLSLSLSLFLFLLLSLSLLLGLSYHST